MKKTVLGAQGEITFYCAEGPMPKGLAEHTDKDRLGRPIISHSESGHHHVLDRAVTIMEDTAAPGGMRVLYALLDEPTDLLQDAGDAHDKHTLPAGLIQFRIAREFDPFTEQARRVAD